MSGPDPRSELEAALDFAREACAQFLSPKADPKILAGLADVLRHAWWSKDEERLEAGKTKDSPFPAFSAGSRIAEIAAGDGWMRLLRPTLGGTPPAAERIRTLLDRLGEAGVRGILEDMAEDAGLSAHERLDRMRKEDAP